MKTTNHHPVIVDYGQTLEQMVGAGKYDWANSDITQEHFSVSGNGKAERPLELVHFNREMTTDQALEELDKQDFRPATIEELLAFGATYLEIQREFPIVELGSVWRDQRGMRRAAYLHREGPRRSLHLYWIESNWYGSYRFLAVRK
ncbi:MAG: hypothetical protein JRE38_13255 [Deltaproteobacteria bacterium]|nr:hypothetical protein [Deltaproteobacteria bacterium]